MPTLTASSCTKSTGTPCHISWLVTCLGGVPIQRGANPPSRHVLSGARTPCGPSWGLVVARTAVCTASHWLCADQGFRTERLATSRPLVSQTLHAPPQ